MDDLRNLDTWRATLAEFVATLLFVFIGAGSVVVSGGLPNGELGPARLIVIALAHGLAITVLAYAIANISGGHINPVVSFVAVLTKKLRAAKGLNVHRSTASRGPSWRCAAASRHT